MTEDWLTVKEAADMLSYTVAYVRRLVIAGELSGQKFGRDWMISRASVEDFRARTGLQGRKRGRRSRPKS